MSRAGEREEFYVGYQPDAPGRLGRRLRWTSLGIVRAMASLAGLSVFAHDRLAPKVFEWTEVSEHRGLIALRPVPHLVVQRPGSPAALPAASRYPLVGPGKSGASGLVAAFDGRSVRLLAHLIYREDQTMLEVVEGSIEVLDGGQVPRAESPREDLGTWTLRGEIVDSKCYLGVMNPGSTKTHRACAIRCISGGIPPVLLVRQEDGTAAYLLLVDDGGGAVNDRVLDHVAEPVEVTGQVLRYDQLLVLQADPSTYRQPGG